MHTTVRPAGPARPSADEANEAIRHLVETRNDDEWPAAAYEFLLAAWAAARAEQDEDPYGDLVP
ncbi:hypothetical protein ACN20G_21230 [Streptomyces sp. BI20]|uniref:hypothetical protein n=1 Tax=Streptomyces sp. BI20 TaxID=3403460 RepID=UPI003C7320B0